VDVGDGVGGDIDGPESCVAPIGGVRENCPSADGCVYPRFAREGLQSDIAAEHGRAGSISCVVTIRRYGGGYRNGYNQSETLCCEQRYEQEGLEEMGYTCVAASLTVNPTTNKEARRTPKERRLLFPA